MVITKLCFMCLLTGQVLFQFGYVLQLIYILVEKVKWDVAQLTAMLIMLRDMNTMYVEKVIVQNPKVCSRGLEF